MKGEAASGHCALSKRNRDVLTKEGTVNTAYKNSQPQKPKAPDPLKQSRHTLKHCGAARISGFWAKDSRFAVQDWPTLGSEIPIPP